MNLKYVVELYALTFAIVWTVMIGCTTHQNEEPEFRVTVEELCDGACDEELCQETAFKMSDHWNAEEWCEFECEEEHVHCLVDSQACCLCEQEAAACLDFCELGWETP